MKIRQFQRLHIQAVRAILHLELRLTGNIVATFPIFERFEIANYGLFPGVDGKHRIKFEFLTGTNLIVGINGLGKTTILTMLLRSLTGPYDLSGFGLPDNMEQILQDKPVPLRKEVRSFFKQRVADGAENALCSLDCRFGDRVVQIIRSLDNLYLISIKINGSEVHLAESFADREAIFQSIICDLFELDSFVDVLLLLHYVIFFMEKRTGALWDKIAQRQILRALFLERELSESIPRLERNASQTDGEFRRKQYDLNRLKNELAEALEAHAAAPGIADKLSALNAAIEGKSERLAELEMQLGEIDDEAREARLNLERAKLNREEALGEIERHKYGALIRLFPSFSESARLAVLRVFSDATCLVCGSDASARREQIEQALELGICPNCGTKHEERGDVVADTEVERRRLAKAKSDAETASQEMVTAQRELEKIEETRRDALDLYHQIKAEWEKAKAEAESINRSLPKPTSEIERLKETISYLTSRLNSARADRDEASRKLEDAYNRAREVLEARAGTLSSSFSRYIPNLISEQARLTHIDAKAKITQKGSPFGILAFVPEMTAADHTGLARRSRPQDVSESQRELIDLAFRLALIEASTTQNGATL